MPIITTRAAGGLGCIYSLGSTSVSPEVTYLMIGGGGGGGWVVASTPQTYDGGGGGGGAGGLLSGTAVVATNVAYTVLVGKGGLSTTVAGSASQTGTVTSFFNLSAFGGGGGGNGKGTAASGTAGQSASGCGGGGGSGTNSPSGGTSLSSQGKNGGAGISNQRGGGGGGGTGGVGSTGSSSITVGAPGGAGRISDITGFNTPYGAGGYGGTSDGSNTFFPCLKGNEPGAGGGGYGSPVGTQSNGIGMNGRTGGVYLRSRYLATIGGLSAGRYSGDRFQRYYTDNGMDILPMRTFVYGTNSTEVLYPFYSDGTITFTNTLASSITNYSVLFKQWSYTAYTSAGGIVLSAGTLVGPADSFTVPASSDYTIEAWICPTNRLQTYSTTSLSQASIIISNSQASPSFSSAASAMGNIELSLLGALTNSYRLRTHLNKSVASDAGPTIQTIDTAIKVGEWTHIALVRRWASGTYQPLASGHTLYVNGSAAARFSDAYYNSAPLGSAAAPFCIGMSRSKYWDSGNSFNGFGGFISNLRMTNTAVYLSAFTPPTTNLTAISGTWLLTCQDSTLKDNSTNNWTLTAAANYTQGPVNSAIGIYIEAGNKTNPF